MKLALDAHVFKCLYLLQDKVTEAHSMIVIDSFCPIVWRIDMQA